jgi:hypothetical protein
MQFVSVLENIFLSRGGVVQLQASQGFYAAAVRHICLQDLSGFYAASGWLD